MVRTYFSLFIPVVCSAACGLTYLHFRNQPAVHAAEPALQIAQAEVVPVQPAPAVQPAKPATPRKAEPGQPRILRHNPKQRPEKPKNIDEVQTPLLKQLLTQLDGLAEGTAEEKDALRDMLFTADLELRDALGENMKKRIEHANNPRVHFSVKRPSSATPKVNPKPGEKAPAVVKPPVVNPLRSAPVAPPAEQPAEPKKDVFDDVFNDKK